MSQFGQVRRGLVLDVPFKEKERAKALGAYWDPEIKKWFVPEGIDVAPFSRWFPKPKEASADGPQA